MLRKMDTESDRKYKSLDMEYGEGDGVDKSGEPQYVASPDGHSGLLTFGVLIFGVRGSGFRMFGVSDVGGSVFFSDIRGFWCF